MQPTREAETGVCCIAFRMESPDVVLESLDAYWLSPELQTASAGRRAEFLAGRLAARLALAELGCTEPIAVGRRSDRSPEWPVGFVGAITHGGGFVAACVADCRSYRGIGIDAEAIASSELQEDVKRAVGSAAERGLATRAMGSNELGTTLLFSAKESFFKCLYPCVQVYFGLTDVRLVALQQSADAEGDFRIELSRPLGLEFPVGFSLRGRFRILDDSVQTAIAFKR